MTTVTQLTELAQALPEIAELRTHATSKKRHWKAIEHDLKQFEKDIQLAMEKIVEGEKVDLDELVEKLESVRKARHDGEGKATASSAKRKPRKSKVSSNDVLEAVRRTAGDDGATAAQVQKFLTEQELGAQPSVNAVRTALSRLVAKEEVERLAKDRYRAAVS